VESATRHVSVLKQLSNVHTVMQCSFRHDEYGSLEIAWRNVWPHILAMPALTDLTAQNISSIYTIPHLINAPALRRLTFKGDVYAQIRDIVDAVPRLSTLQALAFRDFSGPPTISEVSLDALLCRLPALHTISGICLTPLAYEVYSHGHRTIVQGRREPRRTIVQGRREPRLPVLSTQHLSQYPPLVRREVEGVQGMRYFVERFPTLTHLTVKTFTGEAAMAFDNARVVCDQGGLAVLEIVGFRGPPPDVDDPGDDGHFAKVVAFGARLRPQRVVLRDCRIAEPLGPAFSDIISLEMERCTIPLGEHDSTNLATLQRLRVNKCWQAFRFAAGSTISAPFQCVSLPLPVSALARKLPALMHIEYAGVPDTPFDPECDDEGDRDDVGDVANRSLLLHDILASIDNVPHLSLFSLRGLTSLDNTNRQIIHTHIASLTARHIVLEE
jgi:hypothetical protein